MNLRARFLQETAMNLRARFLQETAMNSKLNSNGGLFTTRASALRSTLLLHVTL